MLIAAKSTCEVDRLKALLRKEFDMKDLSTGVKKAVVISEELYQKSS